MPAELYSKIRKSVQEPTSSSSIGRNRSYVFGGEIVSSLEFLSKSIDTIFLGGGGSDIHWCFESPNSHWGNLRAAHMREASGRTLSISADTARWI